MLVDRGEFGEWKQTSLNAEVVDLRAVRVAKGIPDGPAVSSMGTQKPAGFVPPGNNTPVQNDAIPT